MANPRFSYDNYDPIEEYPETDEGAYHQFQYDRQGDFDPRQLEGQDLLDYVEHMREYMRRVVRVLCDNLSINRKFFADTFQAYKHEYTASRA